MKRKLKCAEPGCGWTTGEGNRQLEGHVRSVHTGERVACGHPGCDFKIYLGTPEEEAPPHPSDPAPAGCVRGAASECQRERCARGIVRAADEEEGGELEDAISEPDLETELSAAKEEAVLAQRKLKKYKRALYKETECSVSLRAELAAAQAALKSNLVSAEADQGKAPATGEMEAVATAHARELRIAQARLDAAELRVVAMEAREASNAVDARAVAAQTLADAAGAGQ
eukprot:CAMPEP_0179850444 /NCGR_PEP_ID=MMETSP0982-20121206/7705_1 /TAXON_ID=483367 /ORGANISM="non described non described, Strain CCMP 2436" /LENGTH=227 /DNA_ID=CAMNT_0021735867 /DNA_START=156 /DNA_END=840 /DNA_ORIENTATION=-